MKYTPVIDQILIQRERTQQLMASNKKNISDIEYIAMLCDIELDMEEEKNDINESEV